MTTLIHEGFRLGNNPAITIEGTYGDIRRNLSHFIGDKICVQGINNREQAFLYEGLLMSLYDIENEEQNTYENEATEKSAVKKSSTLGIIVNTNLFDEELFKFGKNIPEEERIGRVIVGSHKGKVDREAVGEEIYASHEKETEIVNEDYFNNPKVLQRWYDLFRQERTVFDNDFKQWYDYFANKYNLTEPKSLENTTKTEI